MLITFHASFRTIDTSHTSSSSPEDFASTKLSVIPSSFLNLAFTGQPKKQLKSSVSGQYVLIDGSSFLRYGRYHFCFWGFSGLGQFFSANITSLFKNLVSTTLVYLSKEQRLRLWLCLIMNGLAGQGQESFSALATLSRNLANETVQLLSFELIQSDSPQLLPFDISS